jgi:hypothetical protein
VNFGIAEVESGGGPRGGGFLQSLPSPASIHRGEDRRLKGKHGIRYLFAKRVSFLVGRMVESGEAVGSYVDVLPRRDILNRDRA